MGVNSSDIALELAEETGLSKSASKIYTDLVFKSILNHLEQGESVNIKMFGKFDMSITPPRVGRNVVTGETVQIPAKQKVKFTMSRGLSAKYNSKS